MSFLPDWPVPFAPITVPATLMSDRTYRRIVQRVEAAAANLPEEFSWANILPPDSPPPARRCQYARPA